MYNVCACVAVCCTCSLFTFVRFYCICVHRCSPFLCRVCLVVYCVYNVCGCVAAYCTCSLFTLMRFHNTFFTVSVSTDAHRTCVDYVWWCTVCIMCVPVLLHTAHAACSHLCVSTTHSLLYLRPPILTVPVYIVQGGWFCFAPLAWKELFSETGKHASVPVDLSKGPLGQFKKEMVDALERNGGTGIRFDRCVYAILVCGSLLLPRTFLF